MHLLLEGEGEKVRRYGDHVHTIKDIQQKPWFIPWDDEPEEDLRKKPDMENEFYVPEADAFVVQGYGIEERCGNRKNDHN